MWTASVFAYIGIFLVAVLGYLPAHAQAYSDVQILQNEQALRLYAQNLGEDASNFADRFFGADEPQQSDHINQTVSVMEEDQKTVISSDKNAVNIAPIQHALAWFHKSGKIYQKEIIPRLQLGGGLVLPPPDKRYTPQRMPHGPAIALPAPDQIASSLHTWYNRSVANYSSEILSRLFSSTPSGIALAPDRKDQPVKIANIDTSTLSQHAPPPPEQKQPIEFNSVERTDTASLTHPAPQVHAGSEYSDLTQKKTAIKERQPVNQPQTVQNAHPQSPPAETKSTIEAAERSPATRATQNSAASLVELNSVKKTDTASLIHAAPQVRAGLEQSDPSQKKTKIEERQPVNQSQAVQSARPRSPSAEAKSTIEAAERPSAPRITQNPAASLSSSKILSERQQKIASNDRTDRASSTTPKPDAKNQQADESQRSALTKTKQLNTLDHSRSENKKAATEFETASSSLRMEQKKNFLKPRPIENNEIEPPSDARIATVDAENKPSLTPKRKSQSKPQLRPTQKQQQAEQQIATLSPDLKPTADAQVAALGTADQLPPPPVRGPSMRTERIMQKQKMANLSPRLPPLPDRNTYVEAKTSQLGQTVFSARQTKLPKVISRTRQVLSAQQLPPLPGVAPKPPKSGVPEKAKAQDQNQDRDNERAQPRSKQPKSKQQTTRVARANNIRTRRQSAVRSYTRRSKRVRQPCRNRRRGKKAKMARIYVVKPGDTLWSISQRLYRQGEDFRRIYRANKHIINNPNRIYPCQVIYLPPRR